MWGQFNALGAPDTQATPSASQPGQMGLHGVCGLGVTRGAAGRG